MRITKRLLAIAAAVTCCIILVCFSESIHGGQNTYEIRPQIELPEHRTDVARIIDAYERLMDRYMDLTDRNSALIGMDIKDIAATLDSINVKLHELSTRTARIERALGIQQPATPTRAPARTEMKTVDR